MITRIGNTLIHYLLVVYSLCLSSTVCFAQNQDENPKKRVLKDTLDGKLDFSQFLANPKGFIPVPMIITEPSLGNFGLMIATLFIKQKRQQSDNIYTPPDITAALGMYTLNGSYAYGALRSGSFPKNGIKYKIGIAKTDLNLTFYKTLPLVGEREYEFNISSLPVFVSVSKKITKNDIYLGFQYNYVHTKVLPKFNDDIPDIIKDKELSSNTAALGFFADWDKRNSIFTPDKGYHLNISYRINDNWTASDYEFQRLKGYITCFFEFKSNWVSGFRFESQHVFGSPPFYFLPNVNLRGIPRTRYQGTTTLLAETEQRFDLNLRWSVLGFGGYAKAFDKNESFNDTENIYNYGLGFRYLIARTFKIRTGVDIAKGPSSFGYYIVFGHNWN